MMIVVAENDVTIMRDWGKKIDPWWAQVTFQGKNNKIRTKFLGYFPSQEAANEAANTVLRGGRLKKPRRPPVPAKREEEEEKKRKATAEEEEEEVVVEAKDEREEEEETVVEGKEEKIEGDDDKEDMRKEGDAMERKDQQIKEEEAESQATATTVPTTTKFRGKTLPAVVRASFCFPLY